MAAEWGTVPDWVAAGSTFGAFGFTGWLLWLTLMDRRVASRDQLAAQARCVTAWVEFRVDAANRLKKRPVVQVRNSSDEPVWDVTIAVDGVARRHLDVLPPVRQPAQVQFGDTYFVTDAPPSVAVEFTDTGGNRWCRDGKGTLSQVPPGDRRA